MSSIYLYEVDRLEEPKDKRRTRRVSVSPPLRVRGVNDQGAKFEEVTRSPDVSSDGALFTLKQPLSKGMRLDLSLPLPRSLQKIGVSEPVYETLGVVVRVGPGNESGTFQVAARFRNASAKQYHAEACS
jgi:PilZ domain